MTQEPTRQPLPNSGVLLGLAVGDALGGPFEQAPDECGVSYPPGLEEWEGTMEPSRLGPAGTCSDDTGMARALTRSLVRCGGYRPEDAAREYLEWFNANENSSGVGGTIRKALVRYRTARIWETCGVREFPRGYVGNGTAMRAAPFGIAFQRDLKSCAQAAALDATLTHNHLEAQAGSVAVALWVSLSLTGEDLFGVHDEVIELMRAEYRYTRTWTLLSSTQELVQERSLLGGQRGLRAEALIRSWGNGGDVAATVAGAMACAVLHSGTPNPFRGAVISAVRGAGDSDTRAAITGACAAAFWGPESIPEEWSRSILEAPEMASLEYSLYLLNRPQEP